MDRNDAFIFPSKVTIAAPCIVAEKSQATVFVSQADSTPSTHSALSPHQSCTSGRAFRVEFGLKFVEMFRADFGTAWTDTLSSVTVEVMELIKSSIKMINCELFSHVHFATPPIPHSWAYLDSFGKFGFWV